jgi:hypothetical protein
MAKEIAYKVSVDSGNAGKSLSDLKKEFKETQKEVSNLTKGTQEYYDKLKELGSIKDEMAELRDTINTFADDAGALNAVGGVVGNLTGAFSAAQGAMALFGAESADLQKTLVKVQGAMALQQGIAGVFNLADSLKVLKAVLITNPIMLFGGIIAGIGVALFALRDKIQVVGQFFSGLGDIIGGVIQKVKDFTDWIGISSFAAEEAAERKMAAAKKEQSAIEKKFDREIELARAAGKETEALEKKKLNAVILSAAKQVEVLRALYKEKGKLTEDEINQLKELNKLIEESAFQKELIDAKENKKKADADKKAYEERKKKVEEEKALELKIADEKFKNWLRDAEKRKQERERLAKEERQRQEAEDKAALDAFVKKLERQRRDEAAYNELRFLESERRAKDEMVLLEARRKVDLDNADLTENERLLIIRKYQDEERQLRAKQVMENLDTAKNLNDSLIGLTETFFAIRKSKVDADSAEGRRIARRQFQIQKGLSASMAAIDGLKAITSILAQYPKFDGGIAMTAALAASGTATTASIAKILSAQFNEGGAGGGATIEAPRIAPPSSGSTLLNADGTIQQPQGQQTIKAVVVETDVTDVQNRVKSIETNSKL